MSAASPVPVLELPHGEARELLAGGAPVFVFVNPPEFHGPHLSLRNDALLSAGIARDLHARLAADGHGWPFLAGPTLEVGCDVVPGPGAVDTPYRTVKRLVSEACDAVASLGARRVVLMTFHGGPHHNHALHAGAKRLARRGVQVLAPLNLLLHEMLGLDDPAAFARAWAHVEDPAEREALARELQFDFHAGFFETSLSLHYAPTTVAPCYRELPPCEGVRPARGYLALAWIVERLGLATLARELRYAAHGVGWYGVRPFPGYTGRPAHASAAGGAFFAEQILARYHTAAREVFTGRAAGPAPIMAWLPRATLGGRAGHPHVPPEAIALSPRTPRP